MSTAAYNRNGWWRIDAMRAALTLRAEELARIDAKFDLEAAAIEVRRSQAKLRATSKLDANVARQFYPFPKPRPQFGRIGFLGSPPSPADGLRIPHDAEPNDPDFIAAIAAVIPDIVKE